MSSKFQQTYHLMGCSCLRLFHILPIMAKDGKLFLSFDWMEWESEWVQGGLHWHLLKSVCSESHMSPTASSSRVTQLPHSHMASDCLWMSVCVCVHVVQIWLSAFEPKHSQQCVCQYWCSYICSTPHSKEQKEIGVLQKQSHACKAHFPGFEEAAYLIAGKVLMLLFHQISAGCYLSSRV